MHGKLPSIGNMPRSPRLSTQAAKRVGRQTDRPGHEADCALEAFCPTLSDIPNGRSPYFLPCLHAARERHLSDQGHVAKRFTELLQEIITLAVLYV